MASETATPTTTATQQLPGNWKAGAAGGIVGALVFGAMMAVMSPGVLQGAIPSMYGFSPPNGAAGFTIHIAHGAVLGVVFAALLGVTGLSGSAARKQVGAGLAYGLLAWVVLAVIVMPIWLQAVGFGMAPELPNIGTQSLIGHAVYGVVLGGVYYALEGI
ncbi:histidine kinase [Natronomonas sp.]|uniref:histidine kinase n=1 Tax=Natronomonas sp. TaxID=2184060 RepID=UPI002FC2AF82